MKIEALGLFDGASFFRTVITNQTVLVCSHFLKLNKVTIMKKNGVRWSTGRFDKNVLLWFVHDSLMISL